MKKHLTLSLIAAFIIASFGMIFWLDRHSMPPRVLGEKITEVKSQKAEAKNLEYPIANIEISAETSTDSKSLADEKKYFIVTRVVDGDTIDVSIDGQVERVRLIGINTPETVDPRKPVECFGKEAGDKMKELLVGKKVSLAADETQSDKDIDGRLLRYVWREDGLFVNKEMVKQGYAYEYTHKTPYQYQSDFKLMQRYAQAVALGFWADGACAEANP
ncbi:hypothetical protein A2477_02330 [Candidatus Falkowbacteria bacterium RIFOXYC2_FULL_47_12]|uniref:TNase-like domain-containing protein n=1 Tax=Candidatus Falkowbacteria bacterium RIFOXYC2_FULL_47_12 TaxID=1798004 RepID=A0A1F5TQ14_9BACT|nr:MAG: hypothetical protein A2477_02330 [Candidatus Falkowbacteria bacterium RIFOXYC2_FULL_47_12]